MSLPLSSPVLPSSSPALPLSSSSEISNPQSFSYPCRLYHDISRVFFSFGHFFGFFLTRLLGREIDLLTGLLTATVIVCILLLIVLLPRRSLFFSFFEFRNSFPRIVEWLEAIDTNCFCFWEIFGSRSTWRRHLLLSCHREEKECSFGRLWSQIGGQVWIVCKVPISVWKRNFLD